MYQHCVTIVNQQHGFKKHSQTLVFWIHIYTYQNPCKNLIFKTHKKVNFKGDDDCPPSLS